MADPARSGSVRCLDTAAPNYGTEQRNQGNLPGTNGERRTEHWLRCETCAEAPGWCVMSDQFTSEEARAEIQKAYGNHQADHADDLAGLIDLHDGVLSFLAMSDQGTGDDFELPDDLDQDTKRQISTARTLLVRAASGIEETAAERLNGGDH